MVRDQLTVRICQTDAGGKREKAAATWQLGADGAVAERKPERCCYSSVMPHDVMSYYDLHSCSLLETQTLTFILWTQGK